MARDPRETGGAARRRTSKRGSAGCPGGGRLAGSALRREYEDYLFEQWQHGEFDDYWKQPGIYAEGFYEQLRRRAAMVHMSSWYDPYARTATENYLGAFARRSAVRCG